MAKAGEPPSAASTVNGTANGDAVTASKAPATVGHNLKSMVQLLQKSVRQKETRLLTGRLLRQTAALRKQLSSSVITAFVQQHLTAGSESSTYLLQQLAKVPAPSDMAVDESPSVSAAAMGTSESAASVAAIPEVELYAYLLALLFLSDSKQYDLAKDTAGFALTRIAALNRRTLDVIAARVYFYYSLAHELTGTLESIRSTLLGLHRSAVLRHDAIGQETLMNLLLRNYLHYHLYDQAEKFRSKAQKTEQFRSNQQYCRYLYYLGRIRTIQLEYTDAKECLQQASRKAPAIAHGFRISVAQWLILVRLLLGEIPERSEFGQRGMGSALQPYFELTAAVKNGDLVAFDQVAQQHQAAFLANATANLVTRLHHNVIRAGLRRISLAYSRISLADVATKLHLASAEDAECIVAKAIRDGGIDATIDHDTGALSSRATADVYSTAEPQATFHARIAFCLDLHNEAVKAMRFEPDAHRRKLESVEARKDRLAQEQELANQIADDEEEDF